MDHIRAAISAFEFRRLFIEHLGWDHASGTLPVSVADRTYALNRIAEKRGVQVFECPVGRLELRNQKLLRRIQREASRSAQELILIYVYAAGSEQVWQWATWAVGGYRMLHQEHPFAAATPPDGFVERLTLLEVRLEEEDRITLLDVLSRTQKALAAPTSASTFFRNRRFLAESDRLARAMRAGGPEEFRQFVAFHVGLARWVAFRYERSGIDRDDLNQMAMIGLLEAAKRFDPDRGASFANFSFSSIKRSCRRYIPAYEPDLCLPTNLWWRYRRYSQRAVRCFLRRGPEYAARFMDRVVARDRTLRRCRRGLDAIGTVSSLDEYGSDALRLARRLRDQGESPFAEAARADAIDAVIQSIAALPRQTRTIINRHFGLRGRELTLQEIGAKMGVSKERVRQIEAQAIKLLRRRVWPIVEGVRYNGQLDAQDASESSRE